MTHEYPENYARFYDLIYHQQRDGVDNEYFQHEIKQSKGKIKRIISTRPDLINQIIHIKFRLKWDENNELKHEDWMIPLRFFFRYELEHLIERSNFNRYKILGDYQGNELNQKSKDFILICQKLL